MTSSKLLGRGALAAILAAGCLLTPSAMAQSANVYVPPSPSTATPQAPSWPAGDVATRNLGGASETADVYIPPTEAGLPVSRRSASTQNAPSTDDAGPWPAIGLALGCMVLLAGAGVAVVRHSPRLRRAVS
jgi:hypothetical protein